MRVAAVTGARLLLLLLLLPAALAAAVTTKEIEEALTCQCGCGLTVHSCNHLQCGSGIPLKQEVAAQVAQGIDRDQILVHFRAKYGEKILSSPVAEGFNLTAWILPFVVVAVGAAVVIGKVRRWTAAPPAADPASAGALSAVDRERLDRELRRES